MELVRARKLYFDPKVKGSMSSRKTFLKYNPNISNDTLDRLFSQNGTVQQWFPAKKNIPREQMAMTARYFGHYLQCDTGFFKIKYRNKVEKMVPVLGVADVWSRSFYARVMDRASAKDVLVAIKDIMDTDITPNRKFNNLDINFVSDQGKEFVNATFSAWLKEEGFYLFTLASSDSKGESIYPLFCL
jgi:hypothetical protein